MLKTDPVVGCRNYLKIELVRFVVDLERAFFDCPGVIPGGPEQEDSERSKSCDDNRDDSPA